MIALGKSAGVALCRYFNTSPEIYLQTIRHALENYL